MHLGRILTVGVLLLFLSGGGVRAVPPEAPPEKTPSASPFGIAPDKYRVEEGRVARDQTFADLLTPHGVSANTAVRLARAVRPAFDVRQVEAGQRYRVYVNPWLGQAQYLVYRIDPVRSVVFDVQDPSQSEVRRRDVATDWTMVRGTINSSLYETLDANDAHPALALRLSEVFAWQIDFFRLYDGDSFRVLYEKRTVDGQRVAPGKIIAAVFEHKDERFVGVRFGDGEGPRYFNRNGQSLRRELLKAPLRYSRISSGYTHSRHHPILNRDMPHLGTDYAAPHGTPVHSVGDGTVVKARYDGPNGYYVKVRHNGTYKSGYLHLASFADGIAPGAEVKQGETIGYVGSTGRSTGPHLDYRLWKRGEAVDPYEIELPPSYPVSPQHREAFQRLVEDRMNRLYPLRAFRPDPARTRS
jgi:murein DD-endopeptidase MepM/ murein hydrolase activator NlpD